MIAPALPETQRDAEDLRCSGCNAVIFSTARCVWAKKKLWCGEACANRDALRRLRAV